MRTAQKIALAASLIAGSLLSAVGPASALPLSRPFNPGETQIIQVQRHGSGNNQYSGHYNEDWRYRHHHYNDWHRYRWERDRYYGHYYRPYYYHPYYDPYYGHPYWYGRHYRRSGIILEF